VVVYKFVPTKDEFNRFMDDLRNADRRTQKLFFALIDFGEELLRHGRRLQRFEDDLFEASRIDPLYRPQWSILRRHGKKLERLTNDLSDAAGLVGAQMHRDARAAKAAGIIRCEDGGAAFDAYFKRRLKKVKKEGEKEKV
jgi:hypothetical protein